MTTTPDMLLILPDVSVTAGPAWATMLNTAFGQIDSHDHSTNKGVKVTPAGLNISSDLTFAQNNATNLRTARLFNNVSLTPGVSDLTCLYAVGNELFYRDGAGNVIQVTNGGTLNVAANITTLSIKDTALLIQYFGDISRQFRFDASAIPTGTTRVISMPDSGANDTLVTLNATQTLVNKTLSSPTINSPSGLVKGDVGLGLVDNTSDATKNSAIATLSNKSVTGPLTILAATTVQFNNSANTFSTSLKAGANVANATFQLPIADGTPGQVMKTDGAGQLSFVSTSTVSRADVATAATIAALSSSSSFTRLTGSTVTSLQGIAAGSAGSTLTLYNQSTAEVSITHQNVAATAANRIITPSGDTVFLRSQQTAIFTYDDAQSRWILINVYSQQEWIGYTPAYTGLGTVTNNGAYYRISGDTLTIRGFATTGTTAASLASVSIPGTLSISTAKIRNNNTANNGSVVGTYSMQNLANGSGAMVTAVSTSTAVIYFASDYASVNALTASNGATVFSSNSDFSWMCEVPIS